MRPGLLSPQFNRWGNTQGEYKWFAHGLTAGKQYSQHLESPALDCSLGTEPLPYSKDHNSHVWEFAAVTWTSGAAWNRVPCVKYTCLIEKDIVMWL